MAIFPTYREWKLKQKDNPEKANTALRMIECATHLFKKYYGAWPDRIGLDYFSRMREYALNHGEWYELLYLPSTPVDYPSSTWVTSVLFERIFIKIEPAFFGEIIKDRHGLVTGATGGKTDVVCEGDGQTVFMSIWFTEQGYHSIVWDNVKPGEGEERK